MSCTVGRERFKPPRNIYIKLETLFDKIYIRRTVYTKPIWFPLQEIALQACSEARGNYISIERDGSINWGEILRASLLF